MRYNLRSSIFHLYKMLRIYLPAWCIFLKMNHFECLSDTIAFHNSLQYCTIQFHNSGYNDHLSFTLLSGDWQVSYKKSPLLLILICCNACFYLFDLPASATVDNFAEDNGRCTLVFLQCQHNSRSEMNVSVSCATLTLKEYYDILEMHQSCICAPNNM